MRTSGISRSAKKSIQPNAWFGCAILLAALAVIVMWSSPALAITVPAAGSETHNTFSAGALHSAAALEDGSLWAWGFGFEDEWGEEVGGLPTPTRAGTESDWVAVSAGFFDTLALKSDGSLWVVGYGVEGGSEGDTPGLLTPTPVGTDNDWVAVSAGYFDIFALKADGSLWSLAYDYDAEPGDELYGILIPQRVGTENDWAAVSVGYYSSLALKSDGTLWSLDYEYVDELDDVVVSPNQIGEDSDWAVVSAGGNHTLALKTDGSLWAWGENTYGQVGDGTTSDRAAPARIGTENDWVAVSAGTMHSLALKSNGTLWGWGRNEDGQVGDGTTLDLHAPTRIGKLRDWIAIAAGYYHSLALDGDGSLWAWGDNASGQLGDGANTDLREPTKVLAGVKLPAWAEAAVYFTDISTCPYKDAIRALASHGIVIGFSDDTFRPDEPVTRQQFAKMIVLGLGLAVSEGDVPLPFSDVAKVSNSLYPDDYVAVAAANDLIQGYRGGFFKPRAEITRAQVLSIVVRAAGKFKPDVLRTPPGNWVGALPNTDPTHGKNISAAEYSGLLVGIDLATFSVGGKATRGEIAQIIWNLWAE